MTEYIQLIVGEEAEYYDEGWFAFEEGKDVTDNPYQIETTEYTYWHIGFCESEWETK